MVKNKHIQVVNENGTAVVLSGAIIVEYLKDYTSEWGSISTSTTIEKIEDQFSPSSLEDPVNKANLDTFNSKIGFVLPKINIDSLINEVIVILRDEDPRYLIMFQSFNNLEKVAVYFILMIQSNKTVKEIFEMISYNYKDISKRDVMIRLLSEVDVIESEVDIVDPVNGLYKLMSITSSHNLQPEPVFEYGGGKIEFKEFTFPMHSYNVTKRFAGLSDLNASNDSVRNYYDRFNSTWKANYNLALRSGWFGSNSPLYKRTYWKDILKNSISNEIGGEAKDRRSKVPSYRALLDQIAHKNIYFDSTEEKPLFKYLGENFFDFNPNSSTTDDQASRSPLTMTKYTSNTTVTNSYFDRAHLNTGLIWYTPGGFKNLKTVLSYYTSDLNMWFTSDNELTNNTAYADYAHTQDATGFLTSNSKSETKGYFSNIMFIQSAIQRVLYPRILKAAQTGIPSHNSIFNVDVNVYDTIFDSIVNNAFVFTNKKSDSVLFENNYEIIPNRAILDTKYPSFDFVNYKATNLYEFIINSIVHSKDDIVNDHGRKTINSSTIRSFTRQDLLYKGNAINYNPLNSQLTSTATSLEINDFGADSITYNFGTNYNPTTNNWFDKIIDNFFSMDGHSNSFSKINYRDIKFFKLPVHSTDVNVRDKLNRNIKRVNRELLTDISDLANFDIEGLSLADFTYGEKSLLKEYIENFRTIKKMGSTYSDVYVIEEMIKDLDDLIKWKNNPELVAVNNPNNVYYKISELANPKPTIYALYLLWYAKINNLKKTVYFPEMLSILNINTIKSFLKRAILRISGNRNSIGNSLFEMQIKEFVKNSAINISWYEKNGYNGYSNDNKLKLNSISTNFLNALKLIVSHIKETTEYSTKFDLFTTAYQSGVWNDISVRVNEIRDILLNDTLITQALSANRLYTGHKSGILKDLDIGLYRVIINNYFSYLINPNAVPESNLKKVVLVDNEKTGLIKYYSDLLTLIRFAEQYHKLVPEYINHLNNNVLDKYYTRIKAIKSLPTWDYENLHRRDLETDLKTSGGINVNDYNITWGNSSSNIVMVYKRPGGAFAHSYRVTPTLYLGGLSNTTGSNVHRDRWWKRWLTDGNDAFSYSNIDAFKIPYTYISDNNINFPLTWEYNEPTYSIKRNSFFKMKSNVETYQSGLVANICSFKYDTSNSETYIGIGVPLLLLGDDGSERNKANTVRTDSFSFETDFLNLWYTDEKYDDGLSHNDGGGEAYTWGYQLVSGADKFKKFGLGKMDIQELFRHFWNMESSPMGNPYNAMAYFVFDEWDEGYDYTVGNFPYSTVVDKRSILSATDTRKKSNKYDFKYVLQNSYLEGMWSPIRLSGEDRTIGVDPDITLKQIHDNFYLTASVSTSNTFRTNIALKNAIFDLYNRNFRNRVYLSYLKWRYLYNQGAW